MPKRSRSQDEETKPLRSQSESGHSTDDGSTGTKRRKQTKDNTWTESDYVKLLDKIQDNIPEDDMLAYGTRMDRLNWANVAFKNYSAKDCKEACSDLLRRVRKFRLLREIVPDMREVIKDSSKKKSIYGGDAGKPKQPQNSYMLFSEDKRRRVMSQFPDLAPTEVAKKLGEMFHSLSMKQREKYDKKAQAAREKYRKAIEEYYQEHPDKVPVRRNRSKSVGAENLPPSGSHPPHKPKTPFQLFLHTEIENEQERIEDRMQFNLECRDRWFHQISDRDKLFWINWAEEQFLKYREDLKEYMKSHPDYEPPKIQAILTKKEKAIKEAMSGRPQKPPHGPYQLFVQMMKSTDEVRKIDYKEAMHYVAEKWKAHTEEEKDEYRTRVQQMWEEYYEKLDEYLNTLPPEERMQVEKEENTKKFNFKKKTSEDEERVKSKCKVEKPEVPPSTPYKYFLTKYKGKQNPLAVWDTMDVDKKKVYFNELDAIKKAYIIQYEAYLRSLSKFELQKLGESLTDRIDTSSESESEED